MTDKIEGSASQHKPSRVRRDADGSDILASFDTLEDAVRNVRRRHGGWRYVIHDGRKIVWGAKVDRPLPREHGGCDEFLSRHRNGARMGTAAVRVNDFFQGTDMLPVQCKMARAALGLGVSELAAKAGVSPDTVFRLEKGEALHQRTGIAIREALEDAGVVFIDENGEGAGVRLRKAMLK
jgi:DNA-binding XRE family transcriptional regulator